MKFLIILNEWDEGSRLHDALRVPDDGVSVEGGGGIEPEAELLLLVAFALRVDVRVHRVRLAGGVPQELEVDLVVTRSRGCQLSNTSNEHQTAS